MNTSNSIGDPNFDMPWGSLAQFGVIGWRQPGGGWVNRVSGKCHDPSKLMSISAPANRTWVLAFGPRPALPTWTRSRMGRDPRCCRSVSFARNRQSPDLIARLDRQTWIDSEKVVARRIMLKRSNLRTVQTYSYSQRRRVLSTGVPRQTNHSFLSPSVSHAQFPSSILTPHLHAR